VRQKTKTSTKGNQRLGKGVVQPSRRLIDGKILIFQAQLKGYIISRISKFKKKITVVFFK